MQRAVGVLDPVRRVQRVTGAFLTLGASEAAAYPLLLVLNNLIGPAANPIGYYFIARLIDSGPEVGFDYFTFVTIGFSVAATLTGALTAFGGSLDDAIQKGRLEMFLVQPISWYTLPFALAAWPISLRILNGSMALMLGVLMGVDIRVLNLPLAVLVLALGLACTHAVGILAASVRLLSKKADPVVVVYNMVSALLSGALFPIDLLPAPARALSYLLPHTYALSAIRKLLMTRGEAIAGPSVLTSMAVLTVGAVVLYGLALRAFGRALNLGRRYGVLAGY